MTVYLTINDQPTGVYASQVADTVNFFNRQGKATKLIAFVSMRDFFKYRYAIKKMCGQSFVFPLFPGVKNWKMNGLLLWMALFFIRPRVVIARGIFATNLSVSLKKYFLRHKTVFDARGAYYAEFTEYKIIDDPEFISQIALLEKKAIENSDFKIAVSNALINYWKDKYGLEFHKSTKVIPCTINSGNSSNVHEYSLRNSVRKSEGYNDNDVVLIYSGSVAGWQSLPRMYSWLAEALSINLHIRVILLTDQKTLAGTPLESFANRVKIKWVKPEDVHQILLCGDYGLLIREKSVTNEVSSPTKFAEYLLSGMKVIISEGIGDFSSFVQRQNCGMLSNSVKFDELKPVSETEYNRSVQLAMDNFTKEKFADDYFYLTEL